MPCMLDFVVQIIGAGFHHQIDFGFGEKETICWQDIGVFAIQLYFKFVNHEF
jgi:hypothetical protein